MLLRMAEEKMPIDLVLFCDTGLEFPAMYEHIDKLEAYLRIPIVRLKAPYSFEYLFYEYTPKRRNLALADLKGLSWADSRNRWCTGHLKSRVIERHLRELRKTYTVVQYIGIAADEPKRLHEHRYPLAEWGMTESDCLAYCKAHGFDWGGLYDLFNRVSCWCCPLQPLGELRKLRTHFPDLWQKLLYMDTHTWRGFRADYTAKQLNLRFAFEEECVQNGLPVNGKPFFDALRQRIAAQKETEVPHI